MWGPGMYMKTALVPKGARAVKLFFGAGDGKSKDLLRKSLFRCGPSALACCAGKCSRIFSAPHPGGFDSRRQARKRKRPRSQKGIRAVNLSYGAGDGNRTRVISLEGWGSTIELRPQEYGRDDRIRTCDILLPKQARYQTAPRPEGVEQLRSKPCVSQSEGNYKVDSPPVQAQKP